MGNNRNPHSDMELRTKHSDLKIASTRPRQRIISCLQKYPNGIDGNQLSKVLGLGGHQQVDLYLRELEKQGLAIRRRVNRRILNFWTEAVVTSGTASPANTPESAKDRRKANHWFWEGNVQSSAVRYLVLQGYRIRSVADTASHQRGIDIVAEKGGRSLWVTVKGYPKATERTSPSIQAAHWFKQAIFDIIEYRGRDQTVSLAAAFPDFVRYHFLAQRVAWLKTTARFTYYWVGQADKVLVEP
jgi:hypothetical protein